MAKSGELKKIIEGDVETIRLSYIERAESVYSADRVALAKCRMLVNRWAQYALVTASADAGADISSYSIGGRSVTKNDLGRIYDTAQSLMSQVEAMLGDASGGVLVGDCRFGGAF